ncbi:hypothetical protein ES703_60528 [subsurface metagenome]
MATRAAHLTRLNQKYYLCEQDRDDAYDAFVVAYYAYPGDDHAALGAIINSVGQLCHCIKWLLDYGWPSMDDFSIIQFLEDHTIAEAAPADPFELTWLKVIEAYIAAEDDHRSAFQLLTDAYKASMYDKPFDLQYHKDWVQRFKSWR